LKQQDYSIIWLFTLRHQPQAVVFEGAGRLSTDVAGVGEAFFLRGSLYRVFGVFALALWLDMPAL
jgi:hypothetical protein